MLNVRRFSAIMHSVSIRVVLDETFHWGLDDVANGNAQLAGGLGKDVLLQQCYRAHEVARQLLVVGVACHIANKEIGERA